MMDILIQNVDVFDGNHSALKRHHNIVISGNIVREITGNEVSTERFEQIIDGGGRVAIPGLVDSHVHLGTVFPENEAIDYAVAVSAAIAKDVLFKGFTTVRDAGGVTQGLKEVFDLNLLEGPRIYPSNACITQTCGHGDSNAAHTRRDIQYRVPCFSVLADGPDEVTRAVREQFYRGASQIKLMAGGGCSSEHDPIPTIQFTEAEMRAAVDAARDYGTYVMAHLYTKDAMLRAAKAGVRSFEHGHLMDDTVARVMADNGIFVTPTPQFGKPKKDDNPFYEKGAFIREGEATATELINRYQLPILFGTDLMIWGPDVEPPESEDLKYYKKRFGSLNGLRAATGNANAIIRLTTYQNPYPNGKIGVLEEGSYADLLLVNGNPVEDLDILSDTNNIQLIMKNAVIFKNTLNT